MTGPRTPRKLQGLGYSSFMHMLEAINPRVLTEMRNETIRELQMVHNVEIHIPQLKVLGSISTVQVDSFGGNET